MLWNNFGAFEGEDWLPNNPKRGLSLHPIRLYSRVLLTPHHHHDKHKQYEHKHHRVHVTLPIREKRTPLDSLR